MYTYIYRHTSSEHTEIIPLKFQNGAKIQIKMTEGST